MKVLLINSPLFREFNDKYDEDSLPPLGLGYIATNLKRHGIEVSITDAVYQRLGLLELIDQIHVAQPDFIGLNIFTTNKELVKELVESIRFTTHVLIGALSTKQLYKEILLWNTPNPIDVVTGDGERISLAIVRNEIKEAPFITQGNKRVFHVNDGSRYLVNDISNVPLDRSFFANEPVLHRLGFWEGNIVASRGCVFNCAFCAAARSLNAERQPRERSDESLIAELDEIAREFPQVTSIRVLDDLFLKTSKNIHQAVNVFSRFPFQWRAMAHVSTFNSAECTMMKALKDSGCFELFVGIESGSPQVLKSIHKTHDIERIERNLTKILEAGIHLKGYFIYGFPDETEEDMKKTFDLAQRLKKIADDNGVNFRTSVFQFRPYHGTELYHTLEEKGVDLKTHIVEPNGDLSEMVGRLQFNFHSGNHSQVQDKVLYNYIYRTIGLNDGKLFAGLPSIAPAL
jgi:anaerobic magnesium-protoporphyrin IX monomethyl ester cyclase